MSGTMTSDDLSLEVMSRGIIRFTDYVPRGIPGYESNIAKVLGHSDNQTKNLLNAVDVLRGSQHFLVEGYGDLLDEEAPQDGQPKRVNVTITPA